MTVKTPGLSTRANAAAAIQSEPEATAWQGVSVLGYVPQTCHALILRATRVNIWLPTISDCLASKLWKSDVTVASSNAIQVPISVEKYKKNQEIASLA
ncbi:hypothetical protein AVEN_14447-1 [Araneus ventricosus]|uniref:Uncharacterized protein n=1 Tax=Araneus ventricosus TaxID=182803 RepID=A0A4Y2SLI2_ARAVE|nr:hypothetical protein AVEN_14447-1 [Araneus ventricosus]